MQDDPFEHLKLDDDFVRAARIKEPAATEPVAHLRFLRRSRRRRRMARISKRTLAAVVAAAVIGGAWISSRQGDDAQRANLVHPDVVGAEVSLAAGTPPPSSEEQPAPIGHPATLPAGRGPYRFARLQPLGSQPVAYDPCRPVHVVVNPRVAPAESEQLLRTALDQLSEATGLRFADDGVTSEGPSDARAPYQPERYPGRWAPVLIAWSDKAADIRLDGDTAGYGGSVSITAPPSKDSVYVTGQVVLDGPQLDGLLDRPGGVAAARAVILHELGHLMGLDHVDDASQIMNPGGHRTVTDYGDGDRAGLSLLGTGRCFPNL